MEIDPCPATYKNVFVRATTTAVGTYPSEYGDPLRLVSVPDPIAYPLTVIAAALAMYTQSPLCVGVTDVPPDPFPPEFVGF
jgi:hypothetical protein